MGQAVSSPQCTLHVFQNKVLCDKSHTLFQKTVPFYWLEKESLETGQSSPGLYFAHLVKN